METAECLIELYNFKQKFFDKKNYSFSVKTNYKYNVRVCYSVKEIKH